MVEINRSNDVNASIIDKEMQIELDSSTIISITQQLKSRTDKDRRPHSILYGPPGIGNITKVPGCCIY